MTCSCGAHHHPSLHRHNTAAGKPMTLAQPMFGLSGRLICDNTLDMMTALNLLPKHVALSRDEPGCLRFDIRQDEDPLIWHLFELFVNADAFAAHQARNKASEWGQASTGIARDFDRAEVQPVIRPEEAHDADAIDALLQAAFNGPDEAQLVRKLRADKDLAHSFVVDAQGAILGHIALSPLHADAPAFALAPLAVHPKAQRLGIGQALIRAAIEAAQGAPIVVLGDPDYYSRTGFRATDLQSPYAGPYLQILGNLPQGSGIRHAPAFSDL